MFNHVTAVKPSFDQRNMKLLSTDRSTDVRRKRCVMKRVKVGGRVNLLIGGIIKI